MDRYQSRSRYERDNERDRSRSHRRSREPADDDDDDRRRGGGGSGSSKYGYSRRSSRPVDDDYLDDDGDNYRYSSRSRYPREQQQPYDRRGGGGGGGAYYKRNYRDEPQQQQRPYPPTRGGRGGRRPFNRHDFDSRYPGYRSASYRSDYRQQQTEQRYEPQQHAQAFSSHRHPVAYYPPITSHYATLPVSAYEPILCPKYNWSMPDCRESACKLLHICRSWLGGECTKADCRLSHSLADDHNWPKFLGWLSEQELADMVPARDSASTNHRLRAWLFEKLPKICPSSLVPRLVCNSPRCRDLHVCVNIVKTGRCQYHQHCASPYHTLFTDRNMEVLRQYYPSIAAHVDPTRPLEEQAWLSDVLKNDLDKPAPAGFDEHHFKLRGLTIDTVQLCVNYGEGRGDCQTPGCKDLHVCRAWLGGACPNGRSCRWVHGFTRDAVLRLEPLAEGKPLNCQYNIRDNLKVVFPCTCCYYNSERGCQRGANSCDYLHLCNNYVRGRLDCRCQRNHDPFALSVPHRLARKGVNINEKDPKILLRNVLYADFRLKRPCPVCSGGRGSDCSSSSGGDEVAEDDKDDFDNDKASRRSRSRSAASRGDRKRSQDRERQSKSKSIKASEDDDKEEEEEEVYRRIVRKRPRRRSDSDGSVDSRSSIRSGSAGGDSVDNREQRRRRRNSRSRSRSRS